MVISENTLKAAFDSTLAEKRFVTVGDFWRRVTFKVTGTNSGVRDVRSQAEGHGLYCPYNGRGTIAREIGYIFDSNRQSRADRQHFYGRGRSSRGQD